MPPSAKQANLNVEVGQVFLGKYRVDAILGQGGMGVVAQCHHLQLDERVAIKMLKPEVLGDDDAVQRFLREAQAAAKLKSEYVARVVDVGAFENGVPYMVMEFLDGYDLGQMLEGGKLLSTPLVVELALQACEALAEAHALGIVHRDVKPTNLFVVWRTDKPMVKVLDFGISKSSTASDLKLTQTQSLLGTPAYMSPEQMRSAREVDARTDLWSLGTVMYEAIEGRRPFEAESFSEMVVKVSMEPPTAMRNAPLNLQSVIMRCLCKQPDQRFQSMADLGRELIPFAQDPHQAQLLVERMYRMLRRSQVLIPGPDGQVQWEGVPTGTGQKLPGSGIPALAAQPGSAPVIATQHGVGVPGLVPGAVVAPMPHVPSQPVAAMSIGWQQGQEPGQSNWAGGSQAGAEPWHGVTGTDPSGRPMSAIHDARPLITTTTPVARPVPLGVKIGVLAFAGVLGAMIAVLSAGNSKDKEPAAEQKAAAGSSIKLDVGPPSNATGSAVAPTPQTGTTAIGTSSPTPGSAATTPTATTTGGATGSANDGSDTPEITMPDKRLDTPSHNPHPNGTGTGRNTGTNGTTSGTTGGHVHGPQQNPHTGGTTTVKPKTPPDTTPQSTTTTPANTTTNPPSTAGTGSAGAGGKDTTKRVYTCNNGHPVEEYAHGCPP